MIDLRRVSSTILVAMLALVALAPTPPPDAPRPGNVGAMVWDATSGGRETTFLVVMRAQADLGAAARISPRAARGRFVVQQLRATARRTQAGLQALLARRGIAFRSFYAINALVVTGGRALVTQLAARPEVQRIDANPAVRLSVPEVLPPSAPLAAIPTGIAWGVERVNADDVWALGFTGQGVVVAGQDTGYEWDHPALIGQYRGWNGITATHDYNWHDAIHANTHGYNRCGVDSPVPCGDQTHGTHTMGTIVGDDGLGSQIGVAPGARWIGCRNMDNGWGTPTTYIECFEFFLAPYPVGGTPDQGDPALAPHAINNSWTCPSYEGCNPDTLELIVGNVRAAGILVVASAGNRGPGCDTVDDPPALYEDVFSAGATGTSDAIASFSSRGPAHWYGIRKPDVTAPGVGIFSSALGGGYTTLSGTSMAAPHVTGVAALVWSAAPHFIGDVAGTEQVLEATARPRTTTQLCGDDLLNAVPNNVYGWGIVDAQAAVERASQLLAVTKRATVLRGLPARLLQYSFTVTNTSPLTLEGVVLTETLPISTPLAWASGVYTEAGGTVAWVGTTLGPGEQFTATLVVTVAHLPRGSWVVNDRYGVRALGQEGAIAGPPVAVQVPWRLLLFPIYREWDG
jgi:serine protease AprX